ncbi:MAG: hypothetical protein CRN43_10900 [Candidatus Nephrothrix sp. EaCA]|nr:MAG: hypothetical protein CRN43_10900 [Candidatus Nephrothrix sp. EaCA]
MKLFSIILFAALLFSFFCIAAAPLDSLVSPAADPEPEPAAKKDSSRFTYSGYFDMYYFGNLNSPASRKNGGSSGISRGFDRYPGQFQLGMFLNRIAYSYGRASVVGEMGFGPNAEYGNYGSAQGYTWGETVANHGTYTAVVIKQAYVSYEVNDKLSFTAGQFGTHIGFELIDAPLNFHYSINNTFNAGIPFYHLGVKGTYKFSDAVSLMGGVVNGTDQIFDNNRGKSFIGQLALTPSEGLSIYFNTIQGNEGNAKKNGQDSTGYFGVLDLCINYQLTKKLFYGGWLMAGSTSGDFQGTGNFAGTKHWYGATFYSNYKFTDRLALGYRIEYFDNRQGARALLTHGKGTDAWTWTLTGNISLADSRILLKPEVRFDRFRKMTGTAGETVFQQFEGSDGEFDKNTQLTAGAALIFVF